MNVFLNISCLDFYFGGGSPKTILIKMQVVHNLDAFLTVFLPVFSLCDPFTWFASIFLYIQYNHTNQEIVCQRQTQY